MDSGTVIPPTAHRNLTERIFGLTLLGFPVEQVAEWLNVPVNVVKDERSRCRRVARDVIADALSAEVYRG